MRGQEMHQTHKSNQRYFGRKAHIGVDSRIKQVHLIAITAADVHDSQVQEDLSHRDDTRAWGDSAYIGQTDAICRAGSCAHDDIRENGRHSQVLNDVANVRDRTKSNVRAKVKYVFAVIKRVCDMTKVRYRCLIWNDRALFMLYTLTLLYMARRRLRWLAYGRCIRNNRYNIMKQ